MVKVELEEIAVSGDENQFLALLRSPDGEILPIQIDALHDLMISVLELLGATISRVEVTDLVDGTYYAMLVLDRSDVSFEIDSRPSDALALAVRVKAPIFVAEHVLEQSALRDEFDGGGGAEA